MKLAKKLTAKTLQRKGQCDHEEELQQTSGGTLPLRLTLLDISRTTLKVWGLLSGEILIPQVSAC